MISGALVMGALLLESIKKDVAPPSPQKQSGSIQSQMVIVGIRLLELQRTEGQSLQDFMEIRYSALYLLGRAGHSLTEQELDEHANAFAHFHQQRYQLFGQDVDRTLSEWYQTSGESRQIPLQTLLQKCELTNHTLDMSGYVSFCLTGTDFDGRKQDIGTEEWEQIKYRFNIQ